LLDIGGSFGGIRRIGIVRVSGIGGIGRIIGWIVRVAIVRPIPSVEPEADAEAHVRVTMATATVPVPTPVAALTTMSATASCERCCS
jgi:hypothetical protein